MSSTDSNTKYIERLENQMKQIVEKKQNEKKKKPINLLKNDLKNKRLFFTVIKFFNYLILVVSWVSKINY